MPQKPSLTKLLSLRKNYSALSPAPKQIPIQNHFSLQLKILLYQKIIYKQQLTFVHSIHNNYAPSSFSNTWTKNSDRNVQHHLRNANDYHVPPANLSFFSRFPFHTLQKHGTVLDIVMGQCSTQTWKKLSKITLQNHRKLP